MRQLYRQCCPPCLLASSLPVKGTFLITLFTRKLNGDMSSLIKLFLFHCMCVYVCHVCGDNGKGLCEMAAMIGEHIYQIGIVLQPESAISPRAGNNVNKITLSLRNLLSLASRYYFCCFRFRVTFRPTLIHLFSVAIESARQLPNQLQTFAALLALLAEWQKASGI